MHLVFFEYNYNIITITQHQLAHYQQSFPHL
jgi:hypothetical protein